MAPTSSEFPDLTVQYLFIAVALVGIGVAVYARWDDFRRGRR